MRRPRRPAKPPDAIVSPAFLGAGDDPEIDADRVAQFIEWLSPHGNAKAKAFLRGPKRDNQAALKGLKKRGFPARSWAELEARPLVHLPWPYVEEEANNIRSILPDQSRDRAFEVVVLAARRYVHQQFLVRPGKPNPNKKISKLRASLAGLDDALKALSPVARAHLQAMLRPVQPDGERPFTVDSLQLAIYKFEHENRWGLEKAPPAIRGPRFRNHEARLFSRIDRIFKVAHGGKRPARGGPEFWKRCSTPLHDFGLREPSEKSRQDWRRKRRNNSGR
jgi:hypothetical protein